MPKPATTPTGTAVPTEGTFQWGRFVRLGVLLSLYVSIDGLFGHHVAHGALAICGFIALATIASFAFSFVLQLLRAALPNDGRVTILGILLIAVALSLIWHSQHAAVWYQIMAYGGWLLVAFGAALDYIVEEAARDKAAKEASATKAR